MEDALSDPAENTKAALQAMAVAYKKFLNKGGLSVGLVVTRFTMSQVFPVDSASLVTLEEGQVAGLGRAAVQRILSDHQITKILAEEGGRTSRGSLGLMKIYVGVLNNLAERSVLDLPVAELWWIERVHEHFNKIGPRFYFDPSKSVDASISHLFRQAEDLQKQGGGTNYVGALLQHLVGAKLDMVLGEGKVSHHGSSVADGPTARSGDFEIGGVVLHVTTHPSEALIRKIADNLASGLRPVIVSVGDGVEGAAFLLKTSPCHERVDVLDIRQFLVANVYERSLFQASDCKVTLGRILDRYNGIVAMCEVDPLLRIQTIDPPKSGTKRSGKNG